MMTNDLVSWLAFLLLQLLLVSSGVALGVCYGVRAGRARQVREADAADAGQTDQADDVPLRVHEALLRLHEISTGVAEDVQQHNACVEALGEDLRVVTSCDTAVAIHPEVLQLVGDIVQANGQLKAQLDLATRRIEEQSHEIENTMQKALTDALTGIANRRAFDHHLQSRIAERQRYETPVSLFMLDVDEFKRFNDTYGHPAGDAVLRGVAGILKAALREMDIPARYGGEEFSGILPRTRLDAAEPIAERLRTAVENARFAFEGQQFKVTVSVGLAEAMGSEDSASLISRADAALYAAKQSGRNRTYVHDGRTCRVVRPGVQRDRASGSGAAASVSSSIKSQSRQRFVAAELTEAITGDDPLGKLPGRDEISDELQRRFAEWRRHRSPLSFLAIAIDNLPKLRDERGLQASHMAMMALTRFLSAILRESDMMARLGGYEIGVVLPDSDLVTSAQTAERVRAAVDTCDRLSFDGVPLRFSVSLGVVEAVGADGHVSMISRARSARRAAEEAGGNRVYWHNGATGEPLDSSPVAASGQS